MPTPDQQTSPSTNSQGTFDENARAEALRQLPENYFEPPTRIIFRDGAGWAKTQPPTREDILIGAKVLAHDSQVTSAADDAQPWEELDAEDQGDFLNMAEAMLEAVADSYR